MNVSTYVHIYVYTYIHSLRIYDFLEVPWGLGRLPWVPGAPPGGSLGGGPDPNSSGQNVLSPLGFRIVFYVDFDVDF